MITTEKAAFAFSYWYVTSNFLATRKESNYKDHILSEYWKMLRFWCRPPNDGFHTCFYYRCIWNPSLGFI